ncbi:MAG TPA: hypothetical protein VFZ48_02680, partial [Candidatus Saccharimonadales bacterium]
MQNDIYQPTVSEQPPKRRRGILVALILLILLIGVGVVLFFMNNKPSNTEQTPQAHTPSAPALQKTRAVYAELTGKVSSTEREYPVFTLWLQDEGKARVNVGKFGGNNDYVYMFESQLSRKGDRAFIKHDKKVEAVELDTKKTTALLQAAPGFTIINMLQSTDGTKLYVSSADKMNASPTTKSSIDEITIATGAKKNLYSGTTPSAIRLHAERSDNKLVAEVITYSEFAKWTVLDIATKTFSKEESAASFATSRDGSVIATPVDLKSDPCNALNGQSPTNVQLINPVTKNLGQKITVGESVWVAAISADGKKLLLQTYPL